jgi:hypothetical protein
MRKILSLSAVLALAACGGGGGGTTSNTPAPPTSAPTTAPGNLVTPQFTIVIPAKSPSSVSGTRKPNYVSTATASVTITLVTVGGNPPTVTPTSVTTNVSGASCATGCTVNGPPSPPGTADAYSIVTFDAINAGGNQLDRGSVTFTPTAGQNNVTAVTLKGVPLTVTITGVPATFTANVAAQTGNLTVTVADHSGQTITGTYNTPVTITNPDANGTQGVQLSSTTAGVCASAASCTLTDNTQVITLTYGGLAENPVVLASSNADVTANSGTAGTGTFTPLLNAITSDAGNSTTTLGGVGVDLYTNDNTSPVGYSGTVKYGELGFTNSPYNKVLSTTGGAGCSGFATIATLANATNETPFSATSIASPVAGVCTITVTDNLSDQPSALPTFKVTYTTSQVTGSSKKRH